MLELSAVQKDALANPLGLLRHGSQNGNDGGVYLNGDTRSARAGGLRV